MARMVSLRNLMDRSRRGSDMVNSTFVGDAELIDIINAAVPELHDLLAAAYGEDYFHKTAIGTFTVNLALYPLPADFFKLLGVDIESNAGSDNWVPANRFGERKRTMGEGSTTGIAGGAGYRLRGQNVMFAPPPGSAVRYRLQYTPQAPVLIMAAFAPAAVDTGADTIALPDHCLTDEHPLRFSVDSTSGIPGGLSAATTYYAVVVDGNTIQVAATPGGSAVDITSQGTGTITVMSMFDGVNGWEQLIVLNAAIDMLAKEESSTAAKERQRDRMDARLRKMIDNRDSGEPETIQDVAGDLPGEGISSRWPPAL